MNKSNILKLTIRIRYLLDNIMKMSKDIGQIDAGGFAFVINGFIRIMDREYRMEKEVQV